MSRRHRAEKREVLPDPKFKDVIVSKFMNQIMRHGKKSVAERIVYGAFDLVEARAKKDPVEPFPFVPAIWTIGYASCGLPIAANTLFMRSKPGA